MIPLRSTKTVLTGIAIAAALIAGGIMLASRSDQPDKACVPMPTLSTPLPKADAQAPDGGTLRLVEKGFSQAGSRVASIGAFVQNTSSHVAYRAQVTIRLLDAAGNSAVPPNSETFLRQEIPIIRPGEIVPVGAYAYLAEETPGKSITPTDLRVEFGAVNWLPNRGFASVTSSEPRLEQTTSNESSRRVHYSLRSEYCQPLHARGVAMVFRNAAGAVVGGSLDPDRSRNRCMPGAAAESATALMSVPKDVDEKRTTVLTYCDITPGPQGVVN